ncbi:kinase-like domain-containing protein [Parasitella parasitica]|nr:kinase-like domain-containing protein [Parasitella parasitica]
MFTVETDMSAVSNAPARPGFSHIIKGKLHTARKRLSSRSKSSPALMVLDSPLSHTIPIPKRQKSILQKIPTCQTIIDLSVLKGDDLTHAVSSLISALFSPIRDGEELKLNRVSGAMTNAVFFVTIGASKRMLLRVYGVGCEQILDRNKELDWLSRLCQLNIGPKLLGIFGNGRFEEYLPSTTLSRQDIRRPQLSSQIASRLHQLHSIVETFPPADNEPLEVWANIDKWYSAISTELAPVLMSKNPEWKIQLEKLDLVQLCHDIQHCKRVCSDSPIVFAHNDLQYGNILKINGTDELVVIDFEYAGYNPRAVDIANHFCEWMYDYHSDDSATMHLNQYPSFEEQSLFLASYLHTQNDALVRELQKEVDQWKMACHLFWGLWGLVQASQSEIDFDYFKYSMQRIDEFRANLVTVK